ncbi:hypothetical protein PIB30_093283 [Stylosanthes scabra]|uniref:Uncharacterized protein n=1 Tax=Stylosanthes scabra TaxID=79078 RepID=A0ABU6UV79_9FABA|nr:hypothetical protein [Stylosanthes scabra]
MVLEEEKADAIRAKLKVEEDLKALKAELENLEKEKGAEIDRLRRREEGFLAEVEKFRGLAAEEKVRADLAEVSVSEHQKQCEDLAEDAKGAVAAIEGALKAQLAIFVPDFDTDQISFFKDIVDGKLFFWGSVVPLTGSDPFLTFVDLVGLIPSYRDFSGSGSTLNFGYV